jgi:YesN/AraC family two-component response regulator
LCVLFGIWLSYRFSRTNYAPIEKIVTKIRNDLKGKANGYKPFEPEYRYIDHALSEIISNKNHYKEKTEKQSDMLRSDYILKILYGKTEPDEKDAYAANTGIKFNLPHFLVIIFDIVDLGLLESKKSRIQDMKMGQFLISNVFEELTETAAKCYFCETDGEYACVVNFNGNSAGEWWFTEKIQYMSDFLKNQMNMEFVCGVSKISASREELPHLYKQACEMLGYRVIENEKNIFLYSDIVQNDLAAYRYDAGTERQIINNILIGCHTKAMEVIDSVLVLNFKKSKIDLNMARLLIFEIAGTVIKAIREMGSAGETADECAEKLAERVFRFKTIDEIREGMNDAVKEICEIINKKKKTSGERLREKTINLIHRKYADCSLNLKGIAFDAGVSPNYLSTFFKEQTGKGFAEYVLSYRIEKAKQLLNNSDISVNEVSEQVGFSNVNIFIRAFKKIEGITPGNYMQRHNDCR